MKIKSQQETVINVSDDYQYDAQKARPTAYQFDEQ